LEKKLFEPLFTEDFIQEMELFYGEKVQGIFQQYVYQKPEWDKLQKEKDLHHRKPSLTELQSLL
jgi:hypothetical protein